MKANQRASKPDSPYAWARLAAALALLTLGGAGMYALVVALPPVQAEFHATRADASLPYALTMIGFGVGGVLMGRLGDRFGVVVPALAGSISLGLGFIAAGHAQDLLQFNLAQGLLIGFLGTSGTFAPLVADIAHWFERRRGVAVAIVMSGNYFAGMLWPPVLQYFFELIGWRETFTAVGIFCIAAMLPLTLILRRKLPSWEVFHGESFSREENQTPLGVNPHRLQILLCIAGLACCVAMSMPQVHMVAYCGDLGYAAARGAEMLSLMFGAGIVSRFAFGWIADHVGPLRTLLLGAALQAVALALFLPFDGLVALYVVSALFGLFQGGLVPTYPLIVRAFFPPRESGVRTGTVLMATLFGMALGGWMPGWIFDLTGSYRAAFVNGIAWNLVTTGIAMFLVLRARRMPASAPRYSGAAAPPAA